MKLIDLRSDTVTKPSIAMKKAMLNAAVGDDVFSEDPTINKLESIASDMFNTEDAIFAASGTQTNLLALLTHCSRGDEYIVGQDAHTYKYEAGGAAVLGSIQPQPIDFEKDATLNLKKIAEVIKPNNFHFARTKLLCLENTKAGKALPLKYLKDVHIFANKNKLKTHLDGARIFNAAIQCGVEVRKITKGFNSISVCLSKGLGAPVGSLLCASHAEIKAARRWRKMLGGGMRQAGILAAAGIYALENNIQKLAKDHDNAKLLAQGLATIQELEVMSANTNMVFIKVAKNSIAKLVSFLKNQGIIISKAETIRLVTHLDINKNDIKTTINAFKNFYKKK